MRSNRTRRYFATVSIAILALAAAFAFLNLQVTYPGPPPILDPNFRLWINGSKGLQPAVWNFQSVKGSNDQATVNGSVVMGRRAVELGIFQSGVGSRWTYESLAQTMDGRRLSALFNTSIGIWILKEPCRCDANPFNKTSIILGVEVNDGIHTITFLFSDELQGTQTLLDHRIVFLATPSGIWAYQKFNLAREYAASNWPLPDRLTFSIVHGVGGAAVGWHHAYVNAVSSASDGFQNPLSPLIMNHLYQRLEGPTKDLN